jgi:hypothetical protein
MNSRLFVNIAKSPRFGQLLFLVLFAAFAVSVSATDAPWKSKPYQEWDRKDLERIFTDSPWSRTATVSRSWRPISEKDVHDKIISGTRKLPAELERASESTVGGDLNVNVYWASSRVMRAASARKSELIDGKKDIDIAKYANESQDEYQIVLQSADMAPFFRHDEQYFQSVASLQMKKSKVKLSPSHVRYEHDAQGVLVTAAIFFFPKKTPSGKATLAADERNVSFFCKLEGSTLQVSFEPPRMIDAVGPDL